MWYKMFNDATLRAIHSSFSDFIDEREMVIKRIYNQKIAEWEREGNEDIRKGRYSQKSVQEWYDKKVAKIQQWYKECSDSIIDDIHLFNSFFEQVQNYVFSEPDLGMKTIFDFQRNKITKQPYDKPDKFSSKFLGYRYEYGYDMDDSEFVYVVFKFKGLPSDSWYTDAIYR